MRAKKIYFEGIELKRINNESEHEELMRKLEKALEENGQMNWSKYLEMRIKVDNLLHDARNKKENSLGINYPALIFWGGAYVTASTGVLELLFPNSVITYILLAALSFVLTILIVNRSNNALIGEYNEQIIAYSTLKDILFYIGHKQGMTVMCNPDRIGSIKDSLLVNNKGREE